MTFLMDISQIDNVNFHCKGDITLHEKLFYDIYY